MTAHYPPRMMKRQTAAHYCDLSIAAFEREVASGTLPQPVMLGGKEHWCRSALDRALDVLSGDANNDWRATSPLYRNQNAA